MSSISARAPTVLRLIAPYWQSDERWRARIQLATVIALALSMVYLNVLFNRCNRDIFDALGNRSYAAFTKQLWRFSSPGEQQRAGFVRALLHRPAVLFLDEATNAVEPDTEDALYRAILRELPHTTIISIAHGESVAQHHTARWRFVRSAAPGAAYVVSRSPERR